MIGILSGGMATDADRVYFGARIERQLKERIRRVAKARKTSPRSIIELVMSRALPDLEHDAGIAPEGPPPSDAKPKGGKAK